ncbi:MAG: DUF4236 domain-containing protein [Deltaproteobacteria bacterium]|nr:DUF4236 domain-containing protein [Deltaproteobacteria bacterium]
MSFRFWRRIRIAPGVTLNLSKGGVSVSFGPRGAKFTVGKSGARATAGIPGTGLFYTRKIGSSSRRAGAEPLDPGFFERLVIPADEEALIDGCRQLALGDERKAFEILSRAADVPDGAFLAGCLALRLDRPGEAKTLLERAAEGGAQLGEVFARHEIELAVALQVTDGLDVEVTPSLASARLAGIEACQRLDQRQAALDLAESLHDAAPGEVLSIVSLAELLLETSPDDEGVARRIVSLTDGLENASAVHAAARLYRARALRRLGLFAAARDLCTQTLRRTRGRSQDLLLALRYERALAYTELGHHKRARSDLERIAALDSSYEDVKSRL